MYICIILVKLYIYIYIYIILDIVYVVYIKKYYIISIS